MARAGSETKYPWGDEFDASKALYSGGTASVGSYAANAFGVHDTAGNVWEWVEDCWHKSYDGAPGDGSVWTSGGDCRIRVLRGGSWNNVPWSLRSAYRFRNYTAIRFNIIDGFRIARTLSR